jgi:hypothetical protein
VKKLLIIPLVLALSGCAMFTKTKLVPQAYMPDPPEILMRKPKDLNTIKKEEPVTAAETTSTPDPQK